MKLTDNNWLSTLPEFLETLQYLFVLKCDCFSFLFFNLDVPSWFQAVEQIIFIVFVVRTYKIRLVIFLAERRPKKTPKFPVPKQRRHVIWHCICLSFIFGAFNCCTSILFIKQHMKKKTHNASGGKPTISECLITNFFFIFFVFNR